MEKPSFNQNDFFESMVQEFGSSAWQDKVYKVSHECGNTRRGGKRKCPATGIRCKNVNGCESVSFTRNLEYHGDSTMGE